MVESRDRLWSVTEVARYLRVSKSWVYRAAETGEIPCRRLSTNALRFDPAKIDEYVASRQVPPISASSTQQTQQRRPPLRHEPPQLPPPMQGPPKPPAPAAPPTDEDGLWVLLNRKVLELQGIHVLSDAERKAEGDRALLELLDKDIDRLRQLLERRGYYLVTKEQALAIDAMGRAFGRKDGGQ